MSLITLDGEGSPIKRAIVTLDATATTEMINKMTQQLDRRGYRVVQVEDLRVPASK